MGNLFDKEIREAIRTNLSLLVPWFLMTSYLYYHRQTSIISDGCYDEMCLIIYAHWDKIEHRHKALIEKDSLTAGTGFYLKEESYPGIVKGAAVRLANMRTR